MTRILLGILAVLMAACSLEKPSISEAISVRPAATFDRAGFTDPGDAEEVRTSGNLKGTHCCVAGWAEYDFNIADAGWYQIWVDGAAHEFLVDAPLNREEEPAAYFFGGSGLPGQRDKIGNVWLAPGRHRLRAQEYRWWGFSDLRSIELRRSGDAVDESVSIPWPRAGSIFRAGQCPEFKLLWGARRKPASLIILVQDQATGKLSSRQVVSLSASPGLTERRFGIACEIEGFYRLSVAEMQGDHERPIDARGIKGFDYEVVDTRRLPTSIIPSAEHAILSIDCARQAPDYESGDSSVVVRPIGTYRQSGNVGWMPYQYMPIDQRIAAPEPSWFAYTLAGLKPVSRYRIDIQYPDDDDRTFAAMLREREQFAYPVAVGLDTGGPYRLSEALKTTSITVWPRSADPRLLFASPHDGKRAACARIDVVQVDPSEFQRISSHEEGGRQFVYWYEEGLSFIHLFGARSKNPREIARASDRWAGQSAEIGASALMPTVLVYGGQLFPSRYHLMEMEPDQDAMRRIVLSAERYHLKVIPEFHPRADEILYGKSEVDTRGLLLVSKDGSTNFYNPGTKIRNFPPFYNVLNPEVQDWFVAAIGEFVDRYRDSPAFQGLSLRYMTWANAALDNLVNLDWGYNDDIVRQFERDTSVSLPSMNPTDPLRFAKRHQWLTTTERDAWIEWRCGKMTELMRRVASRIRQARPDLKLFLHVFTSDAERPFNTDASRGLLDTPLSRLRDAGLDAGAIRSIPGVMIVDSTVSYGRDRRLAVEKGLLQSIEDPEVMNSLGSEAGNRLVSSHRYIEVSEFMFPPERLGLPKETRKTMASVAANRPGRAALERFAIALAETDALWLGDGGNGNVYPVTGLQQFLADYVRLPEAPFHTETTAGSRVVVRTYEDSSARWWIYAVNRTDDEQCLEIGIDPGPPLKRLANDQTVREMDRHVRISLNPYALFAATSIKTRRITSVSYANSCS